MTQYSDDGNGDGNFNIKLCDLYNNLMFENYLSQKKTVCRNCMRNDNKDFCQLCMNCQNIVKKWFEHNRSFGNIRVKMQYSALCGDYDSETEEHEIELPEVITEESLHQHIRFERWPKGMEYVRIFID